VLVVLCRICVVSVGGCDIKKPPGVRGVLWSIAGGQLFYQLSGFRFCEGVGKAACVDAVALGAVNTSAGVVAGLGSGAAGAHCGKHY
jgi:hypothetical protein